jgi:putative membrane protein
LYVFDAPDNAVGGLIAGRLPDVRMRSNESEPAVVKGLLAGAVGGVVGTWAMNQAQRVWTRAAGGQPPESAGGKHDARDWQERQEGRNSNELAAQAVARAVRDRPLSRRELQVWAPAIHFAFGAAVGALYGWIVEKRGRNAGGSGIELGTSLWLAADEIAMPALDLSRPTTERPFELHAQSLASHLVYGLTTEMVRRRVRRLI